MAPAHDGPIVISPAADAGSSAVASQLVSSRPVDIDWDAVDTLRAREYARLDAQGQVYLDYTGGGLYAESQLREHHALLRDGVFGNPHSSNPTSLAATQFADARGAPFSLLQRLARRVHGRLHGQRERRAQARRRGVSRSRRGASYLLTADNHNSVNGIREFAALARRRGHLPAAARARAAPRRSDVAGGPRRAPTGPTPPLRLPGAVELLRRPASAGLDRARPGARLGRAPGRRRVRADQPPRPVALASGLRRRLLVQAVRLPDRDRLADRRREALARLRRPGSPAGRSAWPPSWCRATRSAEGESASRTARSTTSGCPPSRSACAMTSVGIDAIHRRVQS